MKHACIRRHEGAYDVALMCRVLKISRSGYYASRTRPASTRVQRDQELVVEIRAVHRKSRETYGSPRVHEELKALGVQCGRKRVARIMREGDMRAKRRRSFRVTTNSHHAHPIVPNVLDRQFAIEKITEPNRAWAGDITYIPTREGWLYLAVVLDLCSRMVVGWSMRHTMERGLTLDALTAALDHRTPGLGVLHHSDRGSGEGRSLKEIFRCLKRYIVRELYPLLLADLADARQLAMT